MANWILEVLDSAATPHQAVIKLSGNDLIFPTDIYPNPCPFFWECTTPAAFYIPGASAADPSRGFPTTIPSVNHYGKERGLFVTFAQDVLFYVPIAGREELRQHFVFQCDELMRFSKGLIPVMNETGPGKVFAMGEWNMKPGASTWKILSGPSTF